jgi:hypothetical protein
MITISPAGARRFLSPILSPATATRMFQLFQWASNGRGAYDLIGPWHVGYWIDYTAIPNTVQQSSRCEEGFDKRRLCTSPARRADPGNATVQQIGTRMTPHETALVTVSSGRFSLARR